MGRDSCCHHIALSRDLDVMVTSEVYPPGKEGLLHHLPHYSGLSAHVGL